jgi:hypothetical protein
MNERRLGEGGQLKRARDYVGWEFLFYNMIQGGGGNVLCIYA